MDKFIRLQSLCPMNNELFSKTDYDNLYEAMPVSIMISLNRKPNPKEKVYSVINLDYVREIKALTWADACANWESALALRKMLEGNGWKNSLGAEFFNPMNQHAGEYLMLNIDGGRGWDIFYDEGFKLYNRLTNDIGSAERRIGSEGAKYPFNEGDHYKKLHRGGGESDVSVWDDYSEGYFNAFPFEWFQYVDDQVNLVKIKKNPK